MSVHDLTGDDVGDVIFNSPTDDKGKLQVTAIDGSSGGVLWVSDDTIDMVTVARFERINDDDVPDVVVSGRGNPEPQPLIALDGRDGTALWRIAEVEPTWQNIYTPQPIGDRTEDGTVDWLIASGGDQMRPAEEEPTVPGRIAVIDGSDGAVVASLDVPDDQEIYSSPVVLSQEGDDELVLVGTGGELFAGSEWALSMESLLAEDASGFTEISSGEDVSSFIAPVSAGDLDGDGSLDAAILRQDGVLESRDPWSAELNWSVAPAAERLAERGPGWALSSVAVPAIAQLDDDDALEIVTLHTFVTEEQFISGQPYIGDALLAVTDGATGAVESELFVPNADSVVSPLVVTAADGQTVVCACVETPKPAEESTEDRSEDTRLGIWTPGTGDVRDLGVPATISATPSMIEMKSGPSSWMVTASVDRSADDVPWMMAPIEVGSGSAADSWTWGAYMGNMSDGLGLDRP